MPITPQRLSRQEQATIEQRLLQRASQLRADIERELRSSGNPAHVALADLVRAPREPRNVAELLSNLELAEIGRDVAELRVLEAALARLARGTYGLCIDCLSPIPPLRLQDSPATPRCLPCQQRFEERVRRAKSG